LPTWGERARALLRDVEAATLAIATAGALVLVGDVPALHRAAGNGACAPTALPPPSALDVTIELGSTELRGGADLRGRAVVTNRTDHPVLVSGAVALLVTPGTRRPLTWPEHLPYGTAELRPGTYTSVPFVLHVARCRRGAPGAFPGGFYEVVVVLDERDEHGTHRRASAPRAVNLSP
jgi:hypothetical protein